MAGEAVRNATFVAFCGMGVGESFGQCVGVTSHVGHIRAETIGYPLHGSGSLPRTALAS